VPEQDGKQTPPYIPYATFDNFINGLGESGVPDQIDSSLMRTLSGSARSGLMVALRYLKLVDENGNTLEALEKLAKAKDAERATVLRALLGNAYGFLRTNRVDVSRATPAQLAEAIGEEGAGGGTRDKAVNFFLKAAEAASMAISPHILKGKHTRATPSRKQPKKISAAKPQKKKVEFLTPEDETGTGGKKLSELVLAILDQDNLAEDVEQAIWVLLKHLRKEGL